MAVLLWIPLVPHFFLSFHMQVILAIVAIISPSAGERSVLHFTETSWNHSTVTDGFITVCSQPCQTDTKNKIMSLSCDQIMKLSCQSHAIHVSTLPATAVSLALCQQLQALGLNHLYVSVQLKAHSISFDSNKLAVCYFHS